MLETTPKSHPPRVVIADSDADTRTLYREHLFNTWDCLEAVDGRDALEKALVRVPQLVLTEIRLPVLDGFSLVEILRRDHLTASIPIMVVTSEAEPSHVERAFRVGADVVLTKPATPETIHAHVRRLLVEGRELKGRAGAARDRAGRIAQQSVQLRAQTEQIRFERQSRVLPFISTPARPPQTLPCPKCGQTMNYRWSYVTSVSAGGERWDVYVCVLDGRFERRHRTGALRPLNAHDKLWRASQTVPPQSHSDANRRASPASAD
jgi:CheY-like chemotaxis protein